MRMTSDETSPFDPTKQIDATVSRRRFVKFARAASFLARASPRFLKAETYELFKTSSRYDGPAHNPPWLG